MPSVLAFHARPDHDERYLTEGLADGRLVRGPIASVVRRLEGLDAAYRLLLFGHSHRPELLQLPGGRILFNPGSVGCPAYRDDTVLAHVSEQGSPHARYGLVELGSSNTVLGVESFAISYDHESAAKRAEESGRPAWAHALRTGLMPA